jgi:hypothetical protein
MPPVGFLCLAAFVAAHLYHIWSKGPYAPKAMRASSQESKWIAAWKAKHDAMRRIACGFEGPLEPGVLRLPVEGRVILSLPVFLYENRTKNRRAIFKRKAAESLTRKDPSSTGRAVTIALTDRGTLELTAERFIFKSSRQRREFPLGELTHFRATSSRIVIAARGRYGVSYFEPLDDSQIRARVEPEAGDSWAAETFSFNVQGADISEMVMWLTGQPPMPEPA